MRCHPDWLPIPVAAAVSKLDAACEACSKAEGVGDRQRARGELQRAAIAAVKLSRQLPHAPPIHTAPTMYLLHQVSEALDLLDFELSLDELAYGIAPWEKSP
jgi:hypothetical protein